MLGTQPDLVVVGLASSGEETVEQARRLAPDILLLDLEMPGIDGVEALKRLRAEPSGGPRAIVLTAFDTDDRIVGAIQAGAQGYLLKGAPRYEIVQAVRVVHGGGSLIEPVVASRLIARAAQPDAPAPLSLTPREMEVLQLVARGLSNKEIAAELVVSERTVKFHVSSIMSKLGASNRTEAVSIAAQRGLVKMNG